ncbi:hypothetical protein [Streptomyces showdoensis]|uniref:Uncharacterized protein n=1 Tax=Streptomyces showdoensis TaxID=68268 RepID=A0A2P2GJL4_STREW|nr:hypothetical protein [Streptomyces showdoensis]KKZ71702.1 hypothetical protein VO63_22160 [Streptomyces showdoensis]
MHPIKEAGESLAVGILVMGDPMTKMDEHDQEPVDEHQPLLLAGTHSTPPRPGGQLCLVTFMP